MLHAFLTFCGGLLLLAAMAPGQSLPDPNARAGAAHHKPAKARHPANTDKPSTPGNVQYGPPGPQPEAPKTPENSAAVQPNVSYRDGLLTIEAPNSSLGSVLTAIHNKTGIQFEGSQGGSERVAVHTGPAPVDEVLIELLRGSRFDYMMIGREDNPAIVQRVILTLRANPGAPTNTSQNVAVQPEREEDEGGDPPPLRQAVPVQPPLNQQPPGTRTPLQMLEEMKQRELQRRQQQQQQKPDDPPL
jgi:hypothetical protein